MFHRHEQRTVAHAGVTDSGELVPRAGAIREPRGIAKMVIDADTDKVLGVSLVMRDAGEASSSSDG